MRHKINALFGVLLIVFSVGLVVGAQDVGPSGPGGSECDLADNCMVLSDPGEAGIINYDGTVTTLVFKAGTAEYSIDILVDEPGTPNCVEGYCVLLSPDGELSFYIDEETLDENEDVKDISHIQLWDFTDDEDQDGIADDVDNCPTVPNENQADENEDGTGDLCDEDSDSDGDGFFDALDNCPTVANTDQLDTNDDGVGDACDEDGDGIEDDVDNCPLVANADQLDTDGDELGNECDDDDDDDTILDDVDNCPLVANVAQTDTDGDGVGDACTEEEDDDDMAEAKVDICHIPPGNPSAARVITIAESAVPAHLAHGDVEGECPADLEDMEREAPGNSGNAPGNSGNAPGNSGNAPGNSGNAPGNSGGNPGNGGGNPGNGNGNPGNGGGNPGGGGRGGR